MTHQSKNQLNQKSPGQEPLPPQQQPGEQPDQQPKDNLQAKILNYF